MLEFDDDQQLRDDLWSMTSAKVEMPDSMMRSLLAAQGPTPVYHDNRRSFHRYFMRGKAVLKLQESLFGVFVKDVSRQGIGFLSPVALLPKQHVQIRLPATELDLEVTRCRRSNAACFDCGARFILGHDQRNVKGDSRSAE